MSRIKLATALQIADVVRLTTDAGIAVDLSAAESVPVHLSNTRFCHVDPDDPTRVILDRIGLYAAPPSPADPPHPTYVGTENPMNSTPQVFTTGTSFRLFGGSQAATGVTDGSTVEGALVYLLVPMDGLSPEED